MNTISSDSYEYSSSSLNLYSHDSDSHNSDLHDLDLSYSELVIIASSYELDPKSFAKSSESFSELDTEDD